MRNSSQFLYAVYKVIKEQGESASVTNTMSKLRREPEMDVLFKGSVKDKQAQAKKQFGELVEQFLMNLKAGPVLLQFMDLQMQITGLAGDLGHELANLDITDPRDIFSVAQDVSHVMSKPNEPVLRNAIGMLELKGFDTEKLQAYWERFYSIYPKIDTDDEDDDFEDETDQD